MLPQLPLWVPLTFGLTTILTVYLFYMASKRNKIFLIASITFVIIQSILSLAGFYLDSDTIPPRFILMLLPSLVLMIILFFSTPGKSFIKTLDLRFLTLLHIIRVPIEIILWALFLHEMIPELMTFEDRNFDILAGLSAPVIYYFGCIRKNISKQVLIIWNIAGLGLLLNIVVNAILSTPSVFQQFAFDQPNIAILYFPFTWLPSVIVPIVLFSHLVVLWRLKGKKKE